MTHAHRKYAVWYTREDDIRRPWGWADDLADCETMCKAIDKHPGYTDPRIVEQATFKTVPRPQ